MTCTPTYFDQPVGPHTTRVVRITVRTLESEARSWSLPLLQLQEVLSTSMNPGELVWERESSFVELLYLSSNILLFASRLLLLSLHSLPLLTLLHTTLLHTTLLQQHLLLAGGITGEEAPEETVKEGDEGGGVEEEFDNDELREWRAAGVIKEGGITERESADRELSQLGATRSRTDLHHGQRAQGRGRQHD